MKPSIKLGYEVGTGEPVFMEMLTPAQAEREMAA